MRAGRGLRAAVARRVARHQALLRQLRGFAVVAVVCTVISMALFTGLRPWLGAQWANAVSLVLCSVLNTDLNRRLAFGISGRRLWWRDQRRGLWVMALALSLTSGSLWLLHLFSPDPHMATELAVIVLGNVASALCRFVLLRYWIFRRVRIPRAPAPDPRELEGSRPGVR